MKIGEKTIGNGRTYIVAELSGNHNNSIDLAVETVRAVANAGADAIKLQTYTPDTMTLNLEKPEFMTRASGPWAGQALYSLYQKAYMPWEWQAPLQTVARAAGLDLFSTPFDFTAVDFLAELAVPAYKIASYEITDIPLIEHVARQNRPVIISTGIADEGDISLALEACSRAGNSDIILLKCTSEYPTPPEEANLSAIPLMRDRFGVLVGLSDHTLGMTVPIASVGLGIAMLEKHVILDRSLGGVDSTFSLDVNELREMVKAVRYVEKAMGTPSLMRSPKIEEEARNSSRSLYVARSVSKGELITPENLRSVRPGHGLHPKYYYSLIGKRFSRNAEVGTPMSFSLVEREN